MLLSYITGRSQLGRELVPCIAAALRAGVDIVQIREKDLPAREFHALVSQVLQLPNPYQSRILVNERVDVALATGADGVHLPSGSPAVRDLRRIAPVPFTIGVSCHSREEVEEAADSGADFVVFGPVYETPSKKGYGSPQGVERLREVCRSVEIPVLALGGLRLDNAAACIEAGAAGLAAISLFQQREDLADTVRQLRALGDHAPDSLVR